MWDLRLPAGLFFFGLGVILCIVGLAWPNLDADKLIQVNANLYTGIVMLVFGGVMLCLAKMKRNS